MKHALQMLQVNFYSYKLLSITIIITMSIILSFLIYTDTSMFNRYKYHYMLPDNIIQIYNNDRFSQLFLDQYRSNHQVITWSKNTLNLYQYQTKERQVLVSAYCVPYTFKDVVHFEDQIPQHMNIVEGRFFYPQEISNNEYVVIIDQYLANLLFLNESPIDQILKIPLYDQELKLEYLQDFVIKGVVYNEVNSYGKTEYDELQLYRSGIYLPYAMNEKLDMNTNQPYATIISDDYITIANQALINRLDVTSTYRIQEMMKSEKRTVLNTSMILLMIITTILGINMFSALKNVIKERSSEIGIKLAIGITKKAIMLQFLIETSVLMFINFIISMMIVLCIFYSIQFYQIIVHQVPYYIYISSYSMVLSIIIICTQSILYSLLITYFAIQVNVLDQIKGS